MSEFQPSVNDFVVADKTKYRPTVIDSKKTKNAAGRVRADFLKNKSTILDQRS